MVSSELLDIILRANTETSAIWQADEIDYSRSMVSLFDDGDNDLVIRADNSAWIFEPAIEARYLSLQEIENERVARQLEYDLEGMIDAIEDRGSTILFSNANPETSCGAIAISERTVVKGYTTLHSAQKEGRILHDLDNQAFLVGQVQLPPFYLGTRNKFHEISERVDTAIPKGEEGNVFSVGDMHYVASTTMGDSVQIFNVDIRDLKNYPIAEFFLDYHSFSKSVVDQLDPKIQKKIRPYTSGIFFRNVLEGNFRKYKGIVDTTENLLGKDTSMHSDYAAHYGFNLAIQETLRVVYNGILWLALSHQISNKSTLEANPTMKVLSEDPFITRMTTLALLHGRYTATGVADRLDGLVSPDYHDFSTSEIERKGADINESVLEAYASASLRQQLVYGLRAEVEELVFTHGDAKGDNWFSQMQFLGDFGSAKISTEYKDIAKSLLDVPSLMEEGTVEGYCDAYIAFRELSGHKVSDERYEFVSHVKDALVTESVRTLFYKQELASAQTTCAHMQRVARYFAAQIN